MYHLKDGDRLHKHLTVDPRRIGCGSLFRFTKKIRTDNVQLTMVPQMNLTELSPAPCVSRAFFPASITSG